jgi:IS5 family transposase
VELPYDAVLMFKVLIVQTLYTLSDDQTEYQIRDRLSFMRFLRLALEDRVPDAKTIWLYREQLTQAGAVERLFERFNAALRAAGYLAMAGQIVDATVNEAHRPRLTACEKATVKAGAVPEAWSKAERAQMDTDGRWTLKRGRRRPAEGPASRRTQNELAIPVFGYKDHLGIDRRTAHRQLRRQRRCEPRSPPTRPGPETMRSVLAGGRTRPCWRTARSRRSRSTLCAAQA